MTTIALKLLKEIFLAMITKVAWKAVAERFATRVVLSGLTYLEQRSTNDLVKGTAQDIKEQLQGKRLFVADNE